MTLGIATGARLQPNADLNTRLDELVSTGTQALRFSVDWAGVERTMHSGDYDWTRADTMLNAVRARDLRVCLMVGGRNDGHALDADHVSGYARFAAAVAERYHDPFVLGYEGQNEVMLGTKYDTNPTPERYVPLQAAFHAACKSASDLPVGTSAIIGNHTWLADCYAAGVKDHFDFVAWHPYTHPLSPTESVEQGRGGWASMLEGRMAMVSNGDADKPIWVTEYGSNTAGHEARTETEQASDLHDAVSRFRHHSWAGPFFVFTGIDVADPGMKPGDSMGLLHADGTEKLAAQTFRRLVVKQV